MNKQLERAVALVGGPQELAAKCGVSPQHVYYWRHKAKRVPAERVLPIEAATGGIVTRSDLRPDMFPPESTK